MSLNMVHSSLPPSLPPSLSLSAKGKQCSVAGNHEYLLPQNLARFEKLIFLDLVLPGSPVLSLGKEGKVKRKGEGEDVGGKDGGKGE